MNLLEIISIILLLSGCFFYLAGTVGILRFPDTYCRLHALTKADNLGLLLICSGLAVLNASWRIAALLGVIWMLGLLASTVSAHLIARHCRADDNSNDKRPANQQEINQ